jgi:hypothetical protein
MPSCLDSLRAQRIAAGYVNDAGITRLAQLSNTSDAVIKNLEDGGAQNGDVVKRIADALGVSLATLGERKL